MISTPTAGPVPDTEAPLRPLPEITDLNRHFWTGGGDGRLHILRCRHCGTWSHPPLPRCRHCHGRDLRPEPVSGEGSIFTFCVNYHPWRPGLPVPYVIALVELVEQVGLRFTTNIVDCRPEDLKIGMPLTVRFIHQDPAYIPVFAPKGGGHPLLGQKD